MEKNIWENIRKRVIKLDEFEFIYKYLSYGHIPQDSSSEYLLNPRSRLPSSSTSLLYPHAQIQSKLNAGRNKSKKKIERE